MNVKFEKYFKYQYGDLPIILSVPHGGVQKIKDIPKRTKGILGIDKGTIELTFKLIKYVQNFSLQRFGTRKKPSYIISYVHRNRIDLNRTKYNAFQKDSQLAEKLYDFYHHTLQEYTKRNIEKYGRSHLIDIHGFEKNKRPNGFRDVDIVLGTRNLKSFFQERIPKKNWDKNLRGHLIKRFLERNIAIAPGHPRRKEYVLKGGYITKTYGAISISHSQAMQIEFSDDIRLYRKKLRETILEILTDTLLKSFNNSNS